MSFILAPVVMPIKIAAKIIQGENVGLAVVSEVEACALAPINTVKEIVQGRNIGDILLDPLVSTVNQVNNGSLKRVIIKDSSPDREPKALGLTWDVAAGHCELVQCNVKVIDGLSWDQAIHKVAELDGIIDEIQFWGHGSPGTAYIGNDILRLEQLEPLRGKFSKRGLFWFRTCETFKGDTGRRFAEQASNLLGCRVAGHICVIHAIHGGLHVLSPGEDAIWSDDGGDHCLCTDLGHFSLNN